MQSTDILARLPFNRVLVMKRHCAAAPAPEQKSDEEKRIICELSKRDSEVKSHEASHMNSSAGVVALGAPRYTYAMGPDGMTYAVGGEVTLATIPTSDPQTAARRARSMRDAALAPGEPSSQDFDAAAASSEMERMSSLNASKNYDTSSHFNDSFDFQRQDAVDAYRRTLDSLIESALNRLYGDQNKSPQINFIA
jgi:hypothetical protein